MRTENERLIALHEPVVLVVFGKVGVGKTSIANEFGRRMNAVVLSSDGFRRKRFQGMQYEGWHSDVAFTDMIIKARKLFGEGASSVIFDATFSKREHREEVKRFAEGFGKKIVWIEVICPGSLAGKGNIDGVLVARERDETADIEDLIIVDNSDRVEDVGKKIRNLVDQLVVS